TNPTYNEVQELLDPKGYNISFEGLVGLKTKTDLFAIPPYGARVANIVPLQGQAQDGVVVAATAIRNWLAHRSRSSRNDMRNCLTGLHHQELRIAAFSGSAGAYLK